MANEHVLRQRWGEVFEESPEMRRARLAAVESQVARKARYAAKRRMTRNPMELFDLNAKERAEAGTGAGEIRLAALKQHHEQQVRDYIAKGRQKQAQKAMTESGVGRGPLSFEPDFSLHKPWIEFTGDMMPSDSQLVADAKKRGQVEGTWGLQDDLSAARALRSHKLFDAADSEIRRLHDPDRPFKPADLESTDPMRRNRALMDMSLQNQRADRSAAYNEGRQRARISRSYQHERDSGALSNEMFGSQGGTVTRANGEVLRSRDGRLFNAAGDDIATRMFSPPRSEPAGIGTREIDEQLAAQRAGMRPRFDRVPPPPTAVRRQPVSY